MSRFFYAWRRTLLMGESSQSALVMGKIQPRTRVSHSRQWLCKFKESLSINRLYKP